MSVGAAIALESPHAARVIAAASRRAEERGEPCFVISVVPPVTSERTSEEEELVAHNVQLITARNASQVVQEADDVPSALLAVAKIFGIRTLFIGNARRRLLRRTVPEKLLRLAPPFEIVVVTRD